ncbi:hypothetical protein Tco_1093027 [Tanacetum coccineum]|uniref:Uncharacterized protein n=1 Tax=Tanacetum coccineum TaxID=301880 RepID=A0ABQ5IBJ1_9ASTR
MDPTLFIRRQGKDILLEYQISQSPRDIFLNQSKYALESLRKYGMESSGIVDTPMVKKSKLDEDPHGKAIDGSPTPTLWNGWHPHVSYKTSRPDLTFADSSIALTAYADADHAGCQDTRPELRSEYIAMSGCFAQILWMRSQVTDYGLGFNKIPMYCDNKSAIALRCNNAQHSRSKNLLNQFHFHQRASGEWSSRALLCQHGVSTDSHGPSDAKHNPPLPLKISQQTLVSFLTEITRNSIDFLTLKRFYTSTGNPVKEILLKLNLPDHRIHKDGGGVKEFQRSFRHFDTERLSRSDEVLKLKSVKKDGSLKLFKLTNHERYEHVGQEVTSLQDGKVNTMAKRDYAWLMISRCSRSHSRQAKEQAQDLKSMVTTSNHKLMIEV